MDLTTLDRRKSWFQRVSWRFPLRIASCGLVTFTVGLEQSHGVALPVAAETKLHEVTVPKNVEVVGLAINIDRRVVREDGVFLNCCQVSVEGREHQIFSVRPRRQNSSCRVLQAMNWQRTLKRKFFNFDLRPLERVAGRSLPIIFDFDHDCETFAVRVAGVFCSDNSIDSYIGPQLSFCCVPPHLDRIFSGFRGAFSGVGCDPRRIVASYQETKLNYTGANQPGSQYREPPRIISDSFISSRLGALAFGALTMLTCCACMIRWLR
jgi:hypothetical protein